MTDILNKLWMNIDNFNYKRVDLVSNITKEDIDRLHQTHRKFIIKPTLFLLATVAFSRNRSKLWMKLKEYLYRDRVFTNNISKEIEKQKTVNFINPSSNLANPGGVNEIKFIYVKENSDENPGKSSAFRRLSKRNRKQEETPKEIRKEPTFSEEYLGFIQNQKKNIHKLSKFKSLMKKFGNKKFVYNNGENYLINTKLVYVPFIIALLLSIYELLLTYAGLYFKYQPLIDEYYIQKYLKV